MIEIQGTKKRNLQEQVQKNKEDIADLKSSTTAPQFSQIQGAPSDNTALNNALNDKVDKITGKVLSSNDFTNADKTKLDGIDMSSKQDTLNTAQLNAVNSGMTAADVSAIAALITQMATKSPLLEAGANITLTTLPSGKIQITATGGSGGGTWGTITGSLSNQTDLWNALQAKLNASVIASYRTAAQQDTLDNMIVNQISQEANRAVGAETALQNSINNCLTAAKLTEGTNIDILPQPDGTVIISCSVEAMEFKGSVPTYNDLPISPEGGDTYSVLGGTQANKIFTWKAATSEWIQTGTMFDQSLFYTKSQADTLFATQTGTYSKSDADSTFIKNTGPQAIQGSLTVGNATGGVYSSNEGIVVSTVSTAKTVNVKYATDKIIKTTTIGGVATTHEFTYPSDNGQFCTVEELNAESEAREQADNTKQDKIDATHKLSFTFISDTPTTLDGYGIVDAYSAIVCDGKFALISNTYTKTESDAKYVNQDGNSYTNQTRSTVFAKTSEINETKFLNRVIFTAAESPTGSDISQFECEVHRTGAAPGEYGYIFAKNRSGFYVCDVYYEDSTVKYSKWKHVCISPTGLSTVAAGSGLMANNQCRIMEFGDIEVVNIDFRVNASTDIARGTILISGLPRPEKPTYCVVMQGAAGALTQCYVEDNGTNGVIKNEILITRDIWVRGQLIYLKKQ